MTENTSDNGDARLPREEEQDVDFEDYPVGDYDRDEIMDEAEQNAIDAIQDQLDIQWSTNWSPLPTEAEQHVESAFEHLNAAKEIVEEDHE